ncbi:MAG: PKD domain-containing protein [Chitinophagales bacterium]
MTIYYAGPTQNTCINIDELILTGQSPLGGIWIGTGIIDSIQGIFSPSESGLGSHQIAYIYAEPILGCLDTAYKTVSVLNIPDVDLNIPDTACLNEAVTFSIDADSLSSVSWNFGDGSTANGDSVSHSYNSIGLFTVIVEVEKNGCVNSDTSTIRIIAIPQASFDIANPLGCNILQIDFVNNSSGHITDVFWDFGNGVTSNDNAPQNITFTQGTYYDTTYYVTLTVVNQCGDHTALDSVLISKPPVAKFGTNYSQYCELDSVVFNNISYNSPQTYFWDFGNGKTSNAKDPKPQFYDIGVNDTAYLVTLVASNNCGSDTAQREVIIKTTDANAFFYIDHLSGCEPLDITLINFSSIGSNPVWDLGDGNVISSDTIEHTFETAGFYTVELAVNNGCSRDTAYAYVEVLESIDAAFSMPDKGCEKAEVKFTNETVGAINSQWQFGDGATSSLVHPKHIYNPSGNYNITLTVTGDNLCTNSITKSIDILEKPIADFDVDANAFCIGDSIEFINLSNGENFVWDFGNGKKSFVNNPTVAYFEDGFYTVSLITNNDNLCYDTITKVGIVEIMPLPIADFDYYQNEDPILNGLIDFINLSENAGQYIWNFGDGSDLVSTEENPSYEYITSGPFSIKLIAQSDFGCVDSITKPIIVEFFGNIFVPNAMSPALGSNTEASIFLPKGHDLLEYELEIYSTYGELLFRTTALENGIPSEGWDGTFNGKEMPQDNYVWKIQAIFTNGYAWGGPRENSKRKSALGTFVLLR